MGVFGKDVFPKIPFFMLVGGMWVASTMDMIAAFQNASMSLAAEKSGAIDDPDGLVSTINKVCGLTVGVACIMLCSKMDFSALFGPAKDEKSA